MKHTSTHATPLSSTCVLRRGLALLCLASVTLSLAGCGEGDSQAASAIAPTFAGRWVVDPTEESGKHPRLELALGEDQAVKIFQMGRDGSKKQADTGTWKMREGESAIELTLDSAKNEKRPSGFTARLDGERLMLAIKKGETTMTIPFVPFTDARRDALVAPTKDDPTSGSTVDREVEASTANMKGLISRMNAATGGKASRWPRLGGKRFVLWLVASGAIKPKNEKDVALLFSPADTSRGSSKVSPDRLGDVTVRSLKSGADVGDLTSYAGRRNDYAKFRLSDSRIEAGAIVLVDPHFAPHGFVLVGRADGRVEKLSVDVEPGIPFLGDDADSAELQAVSNDS